MISTPKTCHFLSLFSPIFAQKPPKTAKKCDEMPRKMPSNAQKGADLQISPCHGATSSVAWRKQFHGVEVVVIRHLLATFQPPKSVFNATPFFRISADFCQEKRKKVTRSDKF